MALKGTLADLGIVDLVQFPFAGRKSGELIITSGAQRAELYYRDGELVDAATDSTEGSEVLVSVFDWEEGEFEFRPGVEASRVTIEEDLHRVVMKALKERDERRMEEQKRQEEEEARRREQEALMEAQGLDAELCRRLAALLGDQSTLVHASLMAFNGDVIAEASVEEQDLDGIELIRMALHGLRKEFPRSALSRILVEDEEGTSVALTLEDGRFLVVLAAGSASMGAVSMASNKLAAVLTGRS
ncbi:MAG: DUF4388 domain-containing protein [Myxococcota bacterium]